ncbi:MAG: AI-2E family transporter [Paracoccus sp. (in: a-proteobacteria)]|nr:AI-2E family transporter [Paracoccus sp. (in: a-proteobacteria)]
MIRDRNDPLRGLLAVVLALVLVALVGMFLIMGKSLLLPVFVAVISVYVLVAASDAIGRLPGGRRLPDSLRRVVVLALFMLAVLVLGGVMVSTAGQVMERLPEYEKNVTTLLSALMSMIGAREFDLAHLWQDAVQRIPVQRVAGAVLGSISAAAGLISMVVVYAIFLMSERGVFARKIAVALPGEKGERAALIVSQINAAISDYLAVKTLANAILGVISYVILWAFGIDFALFWAILIGLLNYIPYVGSLLGVAFPVILSMAQFGSVQTTLMITALLTAAQVWVGNGLEPRMIGRKVNMSPFVVLLTLALWSSVWGVAGAVLAVPLTSIIAIIMASFAATRPFAIMLAEDVSVYENHRSPRPEE